MTKCYNCKIEKDDTEFSASQLKRSGSLCRTCNTKIAKEYRKKNSDKIKKYQREYDAIYYQENKKDILEYKKENYQKNKIEILEDRKKTYQENKQEKQEYNKLYYINNKEQILIYAAFYASTHKDQIKKYNNQYHKDKRKINPIFSIRASISSSISIYLKNKNISKNNNSISKYLNYSIQQLKEHIESLFEPWMNWENYGTYRKNKWDDNNQSTWKWQLDHIIPHSTFNYTSMEDEEFRKCWSLDNLRPYSSKLNLIDGANRVRH